MAHMDLIDFVTEIYDTIRRNIKSIVKRKSEQGYVFDFLLFNDIIKMQVNRRLFPK